MGLLRQNYINPVTFGFGAIATLDKLMSRHGMSKPLLCTDKGIVAAGILDRVLEQIAKPNDIVLFDETPPNPTEAAVDLAAKQYVAASCDGLLALGGGSSIDLAKAVGLRVTHDGPLIDYSLSVERPNRIGALPPLIAIPTTAGTGAESSLGCPIVTADGRKSVLASGRLTPSAAICDPDLTMGLPAGFTAATGMDALTHCIEGYLSPVINPIADAVALDGVRRITQDGWLERAVAEPGDRDARWHMMMAAQQGAVAFIKPLGAAHAMSHACGRIEALGLNHGLLNAIFLPDVLRFNEPAAQDKYKYLRSAMGLPPGSDIAEAIEALNRRIGITSNLSDLGLSAGHVPELVSCSMSDLCHRTNVRPVQETDYERMFNALLAA